MKPLVYHCEADVELVAAAKYCQCQQSGLGREFLHAVHIAVARIQAKPEQFGYHERPVRSCRVGRFPYRLIYEEMPEAIHIIAVMHLHRKPGFWKNRLS